MSQQHQANQAFWDATASWWQEKEDKRGLWRRAHQEPALVLSAAEMPFVQDAAGKDVCVLASGDNEVAFALAGMGGTVTSVDISERRLRIAQERSATLGLSLQFVRADVTDLAGLHDNSFDLVYTGGHVAVWIADMEKYYAEAVRILKPGGRFVVNEYHPFRRMWADAKDPAPCYRYVERGPYTYQTDEGLPTYEYHWTVADHVQAVIDAGCRLLKVDEYGEEIEDKSFETVDLQMLPAYLLIVGIKG
jgi:ubiquinone/menaquinone biosynthesis C-methylase UbiE